MNEDTPLSDDIIFPAIGWNPRASRKKRAAPRKDFYASEKWQTLRMEVFKRDRWTCYQCGERGGHVNAHHIIPVAFIPENSPLLLDAHNLVTLCRRCHNWVHEVGPFFSPFKPAGTPMRVWRFAAAYFLIKQFWPDHHGKGQVPRATPRPKRKKKSSPKKKGKK